MNRKKTVLITLIFLVVASFFLKNPSAIYAFGGCEQDCLKCHTLNEKEAEAVLKPLIPDIKVISVRMAPAKGLWEIILESKGKKGLAYVDFSKENIILGQIVKIKTRENLTRKRLIELSKVDFAKIPLERALLLGRSDAKFKIAVFDDPD